MNKKVKSSFLILVESIDYDKPLITPVQRILLEFKDPFAILESHFNIGISIGISIFPEDGIDYDILLRNADTAMYRAMVLHLKRLPNIINGYLSKFNFAPEWFDLEITESSIMENYRDTWIISLDDFDTLCRSLRGHDRDICMKKN